MKGPLRCGVPLAAAALLATGLGAMRLAAQQSAPIPAPAKPAAEQNAGEMNTKDVPATFRERVNLVLVPVTVRDRDGHPLGTLKKEDFQLFDQGKAQVITKFSIEARGGHTVPNRDVSQENTEKGVPVPIPDRFIGYLFDDLHLTTGDLVLAREAARKHLDASLQANERAAIFSTSGQTTLDFTDDRAALGATLTKLMPRGPAMSRVQQCPNLTFYMADLIENKNDTMALGIAMSATYACLGIDPSLPGSAQMAKSQVQSTARQIIEEEEHYNRVTLNVIRDVVRRMSAMPGQRVLVLVSPGFLLLDSRFDETAIMDRAIRANVIINTLDARGVYTVMPDIAETSSTAQFMSFRQTYDSQSTFMQDAVLAELADGTGGSFFHGSNDLKAGFERVGETPEYYYILGFSPQNLRLDGKYHSLKVTLKPQAKMSLNARRGYFAPKQAEDAAEQAKREIEEALFSREEMSELPMELHTQFFKASETSAKLTVLARLELRHLRYKKENDRNRDDVTITAGLFDRNGNYVTGNQKILELRLFDGTLEQKLHGPVTIKTVFDVKPGTYLVRLVARDAEGQLMAAQNGAVEIP